jgi:uncharacterized membrane protein
MLHNYLSHLPLLVAVALFCATLFAAARTLPMQNVIAATSVIMLVSGFFEILNEKTEIPFGRFVYGDDSNTRLFRIVLWVVIIFNSRTLARLIVRHRHNQSQSGYWVVGLTCFMAILMNLELEAAAFAGDLWLWDDYKGTLTWYGAPWTNFAARGAVTLLILVLSLPWFIDKKSSNRQ